MNSLIGKKIGMTRIFSNAGRSLPVTIVQAGPCVVTQVKSEKNDGYLAVQLGFEDKLEKKTTKPELGHFKKAGTAPKRHLMEFPVRKSRIPEAGKEYTAAIFKEGDRVTVRGTSKGKGFAGVVKRHGFSGGPKTHGQSDQLRAPGSIGQSSDPSRVWPGMKMPGQMGNKTAVINNLEIVKVDEENGHLFIKGAVPGAPNGIVVITK